MKNLFCLLIIACLGFGASAQNTYSFNKSMTYTAVGDWLLFGKLDGMGTGTYVNIKSWCHYGNQLFFADFMVPLTVYGHASKGWVEVAPVSSAAWNGAQNFALDIKFQCTSGCSPEFRLRRLSGGSYPGDIYFRVETNDTFTEQYSQGSSGTVEPGYLGSSAGFRFPVVASTFSNSQEGLFILPNGNTGIGTTSPAEKLSVNGKVRAREIKVEITGWPDYVFSPEHRLLSIGELAKYIRSNRHLPDIPPAQDVEKNGVALGEMNAKLLKKIEELTLYLIELNQTVADQQKRIQQLEN